MATLTLNIPDSAYALLQGRYGTDIGAWLTKLMESEVKAIRQSAARQRLPELLAKGDEAFMDDLAVLVRKHTP